MLKCNEGNKKQKYVTVDICVRNLSAQDVITGSFGKFEQNDNTSVDIQWSGILNSEVNS